MGNELTTTALHFVLAFSWWWLLVPVAVGILLVVAGNLRDSEVVVSLGATILFVGTGLTAFINMDASYDKDLLRSDVSEQLQIEDVKRDGKWFIGRGPDGEYVKFTLVEKDGEEDTYAVLVVK